MLRLSQTMFVATWTSFFKFKVADVFKWFSKDDKYILNSAMIIKLTEKLQKG